MTDYIHPDDFDLLLKTTPYKVWMWLYKETIYEIPGETYVEPPTLTPPQVLQKVPQEVYEKSPEMTYIKYSFSHPKKARKPHPFDSNTHFPLCLIRRYYKDKEDEIPSGVDWSDQEVIRIFLKSDEVGLTRVIGEFVSDWSELVPYMKQLRDALVDKFPVVMREDIPGESIVEQRIKKEPVLATADHQVAEESQPVPKWWPKKESTKHRWKRKYMRMEKEIDFGYSNIWLAKKYHMDRKTIGHIIEWAKSDPDFDSY